MTLIWILSCLIILLITTLPLLLNIIFVVLVTLMVFFCSIMLLFALSVEFTPIILLLLVVGAFLILIVFTMFLVNQHNHVTNCVNTGSVSFLVLYTLLVSKVIFFFSCWPSFGITQLTVIHQLSETKAFLPLYDLSLLNSYGLMLLVIGFLLFILTVSVSLLLKSK